MNTELTIYCCMCGNKHTETLSLPPGWELHYSGIDEDRGFCPEHSIIKEWTSSQCPGCVGGWTDCPLWHDFAHNKRNLSYSDFDVIRSGICPRRVNGTMVSGPDGIFETDLSEVAATESGAALADAIIGYWAKYGPEDA